MIAVAGLGPLFVILALVGFGLALWLAYQSRFFAAVVAAVIAVLILLYGT